MTWVNSSNAALLTDLYELTMAASYVRHKMEERSTFDLFVRRLPENRNFLIACGLEHALEYLETMRFDDESLRLSSLARDVRRRVPRLSRSASFQPATCMPFRRGRPSSTASLCCASLHPSSSSDSRELLVELRHISDDGRFKSSTRRALHRANATSLISL